MNLITQSNTYVARLRNVPEGAVIRHTGMVGTHYGQRPSRFPDRDIKAVHCGSHQIRMDDVEKEVIFGVNDLVEVFK